MYVPAHFATEDADGLIQRLARRWAGVLITVGEDGAPVGTHMPILWDTERRVATGHIARANPQWKGGAGKGLIVLNGPEAYVTPAWYPSKAEHGKTVPTWNYEAVHITGQVEWFDDADRLEQMLIDLSALHEHDRAEPWTVSDAPRQYIDGLKRAIVGVTLRAERIEAKRKLSQNKSEADFAGVMRGLSTSDDPLAQEVGAFMRAERAVADDPDGNEMTRSRWTQLLCRLVVVGWLGCALASFVIVASDYLPNALANSALWIAALAGVLVVVGILILANWRTCDQCGRPLFAFDPNPWSPGRHRSAHTFLGSYQMVAILDAALKTRVSCMWCGHEDGAQPKYIVTAHE